MNVNIDIKLYEWQKAVITGLHNDWYGSTHVVKSRRQCGKSVLVVLLLLTAAIEKKDSISICLSPALEQASKVYNSVKNTIIGSKLYLRHNDNNRTIVLINGSQIQFKSAEQKDTLRGNTVTGIFCIDEAAFIPDKIFYECLPWVNVSQAPIVMTSSPQFKVGFFYDYYIKGIEGMNNIHSYDWCNYDISDLLKPEKLEEYRLTLPRMIFKSEYLGEFLESDGGIFGDYSNVLVNNPINSYEKCYLGVDWGSGQGQDETAIAVFTDKNEMLALYHFADKDETQTIDYIITLMEKYKPAKCQIETNSIGTVFGGLLKKAIRARNLRTSLVEFTTTNESKEKLINNLQVAIQNNEVKLLNDETLKVQMDVYECKVTQNAKRTYNARQGYHDDCVIATLLAFDCANKKSTTIRFI